MEREKIYHGATRKSSKVFREYNIWRKMVQRCVKKDLREYPQYGGRGISVCDEWRFDFRNFLMDMGKCPEGHNLDRVDNNGDYTKENCRWANWYQQANNRRNNIVVDFNNKKLTLSEWSRELGINYDTLYKRYKSGWSKDKMLKSKQTA